MIFDSEPTKSSVPTTIQAVILTLQDSWEKETPLANAEIVQSVKFKLLIHDQDGQLLRERAGDAMLYLTAAQRGMLKALLSSLRVKAENEILK